MKTIIVFCFFVLFGCLAFADDAPENSPYVFGSFQKSVVYMTNGDSTLRSMNYNGVTEELCYDLMGRLMALDRLDHIYRVKIGENLFETHWRKILPENR